MLDVKKNKKHKSIKSSTVVQNVQKTDMVAPMPFALERLATVRFIESPID